MDVRPRVAQFLKHRLVHRMRLVAEHRAAPANQTGEVIAEQAPACADIHDRGAVAGEVVGERSGEITGSDLISPDEFHQRAHGSVSEVAGNVPRGREDRSRVRQCASGLGVPRGHRSPSGLDLRPMWSLHTFWNLSLDPVLYILGGLAGLCSFMCKSSSPQEASAPVRNPRTEGLSPRRHRPCPRDPYVAGGLPRPGLARDDRWLGPASSQTRGKARNIRVVTLIPSGCTARRLPKRVP